MQNRSNMMVISFALSVLFWWWLLGSINMAVGILVLIFVHEMGHYLAARQLGITVSPPIFMGPLGAAIEMPLLPRSAKEEAYVAFAGPLFGTIGGIIALVLGLTLGVSALISLAVWSFWLNLFNLIPLAPLDGGRISMAIERRMWVIGLPMILWLLTSGPSSTFGMVVIFFILMNAISDIQARKQLALSNPDYFDVGFNVRLGYGIAYLALGAFLFWAVTNPYALVALLVQLGL